MRKLIIVEDQPIIAENLRQIVESFDYKVIAVCHSYQEAVSAMEVEVPDLLLVDINLGKGEKTGIDLISDLREQQSEMPAVVFVTANSDSETIAEAANVHPDGYIVKPFQKETIHSTIEIVLSNKDDKESKSKAYIEVRKKGLWKKVLLKEITFIKSDGVYSDIHTIDDKKYVKRTYLKSLAEQLPENQFIRPHKSYIVQLEYVDSYNSKCLKVRGEEVPIGRTHKQEVLELLRNRK